ncbi:MAG: PHP domain-containing protein [Lachnospiraceae bacterium]|nr:PHP domain-containing protein [Lachnospiraceae bacterium]
MDTRKIDLHVHSTESDGTFTPAELVLEAQKAGLSAFALTDHDTVNGVAAAKEAAKNTEIELISGVELSTEYKDKEVHVVGLFLDETDSALLKHLALFRQKRDGRNEAMCALLRKEGFDITEEAMRKMFPEAAVLTRAHVANFLVNKGYISSISVAFDKYIGDGCRCQVSREMITPQEGIKLIHNAGGVAVLAHPILYKMSDTRIHELLADCKNTGLDGVEAIYSTYQPGDERYIRKLAAEYDLKISGGSDFHGTNKPRIKLGTGMGNMYVPYEVLDNLRP